MGNIATAVAQVFGARVAQRRKALGLTAQELADLVGGQGFPMSRATVAKIENGLRESGPTLDEALAFALALRVPLPLLLVPDGKDPYNITPATSVFPGRALNWLLRGEALTDENVRQWTSAAWPVWQFHDAAEARQDVGRAGADVRSAERLGRGQREARIAYAAALRRLRHAVDALERFGLAGLGWWSDELSVDYAALAAEEEGHPPGPLFAGTTRRTDEPDEGDESDALGARSVDDGR